MITPAQIKAGRELLGWSVMRLSVKAGLTLATARRAERLNQHGVGQSKLERIKRVFEDAGIEFTDGDKPGVRMEGAADHDRR